MILLAEFHDQMNVLISDPLISTFQSSLQHKEYPLPPYLL